MDIFPRELREDLRRAVESGALRRVDDLESVADKLTDIFQCDSLDLIELCMALEKQKKSIVPKTVGELIDLLESDGPDDLFSPVARK
jgi:acyl carrier protein